MRDLVLGGSERRAEPVDDVVSDVGRRVENNHVRDNVNASHSLASIEVNVLNLFLDLVALHGSLQNGENATDARFLLLVLLVLSRLCRLIVFVFSFLILSVFFRLLARQLMRYLKLYQKVALFFDHFEDFLQFCFRFGESVIGDLAGFFGGQGLLFVFVFIGLLLLFL